MASINPMTGGAPSQGGRRSTNGSGQDDSEQKIAELRQELSRLASETARIADSRMRRLSSQTQETMRQHPWLTVSMAAAGGVLLAMLLGRRSSSGERNWRRYAPEVDLSGFRQRLAQSIPQSSEPLSSRLERLADQISQINPKALSSPAFTQARSLLQQFLGGGTGGSAGSGTGSGGSSRGKA